MSRLLYNQVNSNTPWMVVRLLCSNYKLPNIVHYNIYENLWKNTQSYSNTCYQAELFLVLLSLIFPCHPLPLTQGAIKFQT